MDWKWIIVGIFLLWLAWDAIVVLAGVPQIAPWTLKAWLDSTSPPVLVDVRTEREYRFFHIPGARHMGWPANPKALADVPRDSSVIMVCLTGHRSPLAALSLKRAGFTSVYNLTWGTLVWKLLGNPTRSGEEP